MVLYFALYVFLFFLNPKQNALSLFLNNEVSGEDYRCEIFFFFFSFFGLFRGCLLHAFLPPLSLSLSEKVQKIIFSLFCLMTKNKKKRFHYMRDFLNFFGV